MPTLLLLGAGGLAREVLASLRQTQEYRIYGFLDDDRGLHGTMVDGVPVLGGLGGAAKYPRCSFLACAGSGTVRAGMVQILARAGVGEERFATFIAPGVSLTGSCTVGAGSILLAGTVLTAAVTVGRHVAVMPNCTLTHDDVVEDYATLTAGVCLGGGVRVGAGAYLGMAATVRQGVRIGAGTVVGMGSAVLRDLPGGQTWAGVPARELKRLQTTLPGTVPAAATDGKDPR
ncbi:NeuD/PglB/VioB family sugar acetyltransferase [Arthrobacter sp. APC 3897]|uniref:NeuD/PglB/VioB family sugar acetyltransferase n=1 Tax=Arthrobacter sp. APC 3897 TaxID=3035204 RepID=UPI0025B53D76|nr:NeuD/PglB/VioB family sugar acetyltransferase [Arthrobacter sp. APC 3897]MDN3482572.1 NeuD/PglB/VioB family sugar acetyltransferase [Arthrobacter sp. APC 3897]